MTFFRASLDAQRHTLRFLDERDLHFAWRSCKALQKTAGDNRLWQPFLAKRAIGPTEDNKQRLTAYFKTACYVFNRDCEKQRRKVNKHLHAKSAQQIAMDDNSPMGDVIVISRARHREMLSNNIDIYDLFAAIYKSSIESPEFIRDGLHFPTLPEDLDVVRFLCELGVDAGKPHEGQFALDIVLTNTDCSVEVVKLLMDAKAWFSLNRYVDNAQQGLDGTIDIAARYSSPDVFRYLWALLPSRVDPMRNHRGELTHCGTFTNALLNPLLINEDEIIKTLIAAGAKPDAESRNFIANGCFFHLPPGSFGTYNSLNAVLAGRVCTFNRIQLLLDAGARPTQALFPSRVGSLDLAVRAKVSKESLELLLQHGATLSDSKQVTREYWWPGTVEYARQQGLPEESIQLLEEAARVQFAPAEPAPLVEQPLAEPERVDPVQPADPAPAQPVERQDEAPRPQEAPPHYRGSIIGWIQNVMGWLYASLCAAITSFIDFLSDDREEIGS